MKDSRLTSSLRPLTLSLALAGAFAFGGSALAQDDAASGNAGDADAGADGGAVVVEDVNSGGNEGNVIEVGDTGAPVEETPVPEAPKPDAPAAPAPAAPAAPAPAAPAPEALPRTGVGAAVGVQGGAAMLFAALSGAAGAGYALRRRFGL